jgi:hypothetical protein
MRRIQFGAVKLLTHAQISYPGIETVSIERLDTIEAYSAFVFKKLWKYVSTDHVLIIQWDGFVLNPHLWDNEFLQYDYIGAPWWYDSRNVGNGGFSLRSKKLLLALMDPVYTLTHPEDDKICREYGHDLEMMHDIRFAPEELAAKFSFEPSEKYTTTDLGTFGFHALDFLYCLCEAKATSNQELTGS